MVHHSSTRSFRECWTIANQLEYNTAEINARFEFYACYVCIHFIFLDSLLIIFIFLCFISLVTVKTYIESSDVNMDRNGLYVRQALIYTQKLHMKVTSTPQTSANEPGPAKNSTSHKYTSDPPHESHKYTADLSQ